MTYLCGSAIDSEVQEKSHIPSVLDPQEFDSSRRRIGVRPAVVVFATNVAEDTAVPPKTVRINRDRSDTVKMKFGREPALKRLKASRKAFS